MIDGVIQTVTNTSVPKAVRITAKGTVDFAFRPGGQGTSRTAVAVQEASAGFSVGSFLVGTTGAQDTVLNAIFGDAFHAQVLSYQGLASANVTTSLRKLGLNMPVTVLSPTEVLNTSISAKNLMLASASALNDGNHAAAVNVLNALAASVTADTMVRLGDFIKVESGGEDAGRRRRAQRAPDAHRRRLHRRRNPRHHDPVGAGQHSRRRRRDHRTRRDLAGRRWPSARSAHVAPLPPRHTQVHLQITPQIHVTTAPTRQRLQPAARSGASSA